MTPDEPSWSVTDPPAAGDEASLELEALVQRAMDVQAGAFREADFSDEELLQLYIHDHDRRPFECLIRRYERELYNYLRRYLSDGNLAEEAFQNTFVQVHLKCRQFDRQFRFRPWLYSIATHQAIDVLRRKKRTRTVSLESAKPFVGAAPSDLLSDHLQSREPCPREAFHNDERRQWIQDAVGRLPSHLRHVIMLAYYQGLKYREIAAALKLPVGTVKSRLHTAIRKLHDAWRETELADDA